MPTLAALFTRVSGGSSSVSASQASKTLLKAGNFGFLSLTGGMLKKGIDRAMALGDRNKDGELTQDEFVDGIRSAAQGKPRLSWSEFDPAGAGELDAESLAVSLGEVARKRAGGLAGVIDARAVARIVIAMTDDDGNGKVSKAEYESLVADLK